MLIVANWKAYIEDLTKAKKLVAVSKKFSRETDHKFVLAPPAPLLSVLAQKNTTSVAFAAQDISLTAGGAETGEETAAVFVAAGASYALIGHSECRARGDTNAIVAQKLIRAIAQGLTPILCVGEQERDDDGYYLNTIREEITVALSALQPKERSVVIIAYEPLWAIGKSAEFAIPPDDLGEMTLYIRKVLAELLPGRTSAKSRVLYGGSVEAADIRLLMSGSSVDGFLIGHASIDPHTFTNLVRQLG